MKDVSKEWAFGLIASLARAQGHEEATRGAVGDLWRGRATPWLPVATRRFVIAQIDRLRPAIEDLE